MNYNEKNSHPRDRRLRFDPEAHTYAVICPDGSEIACESVTTVVDNLFEKFDADYWAARKATAEKSADLIKREWEEKGRIAREKGTLMHDRIEKFYLGEQSGQKALSNPEFLHFLEFAKDYTLEPFRSEWRIFSEKYRIAGTLDFLACSNGVFDIYDWKRSSNLVDEHGNIIKESKYGKTGKSPIAHVQDITFYHYAVQVSLYCYILESEYGIQIRHRRLGIFHPSYDRYYVVDLPYMRKEGMDILNTRL